MSSDPPEITIEQRLLVPRVVVGAMIGGLLAFAVVVWLVSDRVETQPGDNLLVIVAALILLAGVAINWGFGRFQEDRYRRRDLADDGEVARAFFETTVTRAAALELPGFVCLVAFMTSGRPLVLVGAGIAAMLMAALFPSRESFERFRDRVTEPR